MLNTGGLRMKTWVWIKNNIHKGLQWIKSQYSGSSMGVQWMANIIIPITVAVQCMGTGLPSIIDFTIFTVVSFGLLCLIRGFLMWITKPICKPYFRVILNGAILFTDLYLFLYVSVSSRISTIWMVTYAGVVVLVEHLLARSLFVIIKCKKIRSLPFITLLLGLGFNIVFCIFIFGSGIKTHTLEAYIDIEQSDIMENVTPLLSSQWEAGIYQVASLDYGIDEEDDLTSTTIDLSNYLWDNTGIKRWTRQTYLGYDITQVPLRGRIWYPEDAKNCPVVFIIHGNHTMVTDSYLGYAYLGEHLASLGYVVVSVDENVCNYYLPEGLSGENAGRAHLLLENMRQVKNYNNLGPLAGKLNYEKLALIGHSRGGEAVALAALYNKLGHDPDAGYQSYSYHYNIQSVIAIAPSVDQYLPSGRDVTLTDINYLLIQGANDSDVSIFMGMKQYNNIKFTGNKDSYKTYLYIAGANHGQFNTTWQQDFTFPNSLMINKVDIMKDSEQRKILKSYVTTFLEDTLLGKKENRSLFQSNLHKRKGLPATVYISGYKDGSFVPLADYEEDISLTTITVPNGMSKCEDIYFNREQAVTYYEEDGSYETANHAAYLWWNQRSAKYGLYFNQQAYDLKESSYLQFDVADIDTERTPKSKEELLNYEIIIKDSSGNSASVELAKICKIYPPLYIRLFKLQFSKNIMDVKTEMQTVRIPLKEFKVDSESLDLSKVTSIEFAFTKQETGRILLDNVGFSK